MKIITYPFAFIILFICHYSWAAITVDRTRLIYEGDEKAVSLMIKNTDTSKPYLAQLWLEDDKGNKITNDAPFILTPPILRMNAGEKNIIKVVSTKLAEHLPNDRESLFYLNVREIPQRNKDKNVLQVALQTSMKFIYRPKNISLKPGEFRGAAVSANAMPDGMEMINPTPYFYTVVGFSKTKDDREQDGFSSFVLEPYSKKIVSTPSINPGEMAWVTFINDFGGREQIQLSIGRFEK